MLHGLVLVKADAFLQPAGSPETVPAPIGVGAQMPHNELPGAAASHASPREVPRRGGAPDHVDVAVRV